MYVIVYIIINIGFAIIIIIYKRLWFLLAW